jgi:hypothetical protein
MNLATTLTTVVLLISVRVQAGPLITDGLVTGYEFSGNANDVSGNGNDGTPYGATLTADRYGISNSSYYFDGDDYILASAALLPTAERTVALWFRADTLSSLPNLVGYGGSDYTPPGTSWLMGINHWGDPAYSITSHWGTNTLQYYYTNEPVETWTHFAITTDISGTRIYVNGREEAANTNFIDNTVVAGTDLVLGVAVDTYGYAPYTDDNVGYFVGSLDDVLIYNRALTASEIKRLAAPVPIPATVLLLGSGLVSLAGIKIRRKQK